MRVTILNCDVERSTKMRAGDLEVSNLVIECCRNIGVAATHQHYQPTGDGALISVHSPLLAELLAENLHREAFRRFNANARREEECCSLRVGLATGEIEMRAGRWYDHGKQTMVSAERLQKGCKTGQILIDEPTFRSLPRDRQLWYGRVEILTGKSHDPSEIRAYRRRVVPAAPWAHTWSSSSSELRSLFNVGLGAIAGVREEVHSICAQIRCPGEMPDELGSPVTPSGGTQEIAPLAIRLNDQLTARLAASGYPSASRTHAEGDRLEDWPKLDAKAAPYRWVVDGIDGSRHILRGLPFFATTIALVSGKVQEPVLGFTYVPITDEMFFAAKGEGAYLNDWEHHLKVSDAPPDQGVVYVEFPNFDHRSVSRLARDIGQLGKITRNVRRIQGFGLGALGLAYVAKGAFCAYVDFSHTSYLHNMAAGCLLVKEAGGAVVNLGTKKLPRYMAGAPNCVRALRRLSQVQFKSRRVRP